MTTLATPPLTIAPDSEPRARFCDLLAAEWSKLWSLRSTPWALGLSALAILGINVNGAVADYNNWPRYNAGIRALFVPVWAMRDAFNNNAAMIVMLVAGSIGAITIVSEYSSGLVRTTFAAIPDRRSLVAAKMAVVTVVMLAYGTLTAASSFGLTQAILSGRHIGLSISYPGALQAVAASALLAPVSALVGMGIGALIRHSATTMVTTSLVLIVLPSFFTDSHRWTADLDHAMPHNAWQRLVNVDYAPFGPVHYPATTTGAWIVFAAWPLLAAIIAMVVVRRRDL